MENVNTISLNANESTTTANILKFVFLIFITVFSLFFGYYTLICKHSKRFNRYLGFFNTFSGGISMGIGLFVLLPQSRNNLDEWSKDLQSDILKELPYCYFISFGAYSLMLFVEKVLFNSPSLIPMMNENESGHSHAHDNEDRKDELENSDDEEEAMKNVVSAKGKFASFLGMRNTKISQVNNGTGSMDRNQLKASILLTKTFSKTKAHNADLDLLVNPKNPFTVSKKKESNPHSHDSHDSQQPKLSNTTPYILLLALCLDGIFEGIALGLQTSLATVIFIASALIINKTVVAYSVGVSIKNSDTDIDLFIRLILFFSLICPFGIVIGYLCSSNLLLSGILLSFSTGTFIYVACSVVIVEEFTITKFKYLKYFCYLIGACLTGGIVVLETML